MAEHETCIGASNGWYTPPEIFQALGLRFELDPCWSSSIYCAVPCRRAFAADQGAAGLSHQWVGMVFMNPPFGGRHGHVPWLKKFLDHGNGVAIVRAYTSSDWWHQHVAPRAQTLVFPKGKTKFIRPDGTIGKAPGHGVALIGMGETANAALSTCNLGWFVDNATKRLSRR